MKNIKKLSLFLIICLTMSFVPKIKTAAVTNNSLVLGNSEITLTQGQSGRFTVSVTNLGGKAVSGVSVSAGGSATAYLDGTSIAVYGMAMLVVSVPTDTTGTTDVPLSFTYSIDGETGIFDQSLSISVEVKSAQATPTPTPKPDKAPVLSLTSPSSYVTLTAGKAAVIDVAVQNQSSYIAYNTTFSTSPMQNFIVEFAESVPKFNFIPNSTKNIKLRIVPDKDLAPGNYNVSFGYSYANEYGDIFTGKMDILLKVVAEPTKTPKVELVSPVNYVSTLPGKSKSIEVTLKNTSTFNAKNVNISLVPTPDFIMELPVDVPAFELRAGASRQFSLQVTPDKELKAGNYEVGFNYSYTNDDGTIFNETGTVLVKVEKADDAVEKEPNISLFGFSVDPEQIVAGGEFKVALSLQNTGLQTAKDLRISIDNLKTDEITLYNTINGKPLGDVAPNAVLSDSFSLFANEALKTGSYPLTFKINYKDETGKEHSDSFTYYFSVRAKDEDDKKPDISLLGFSVDSQKITAGEEFKVTLSLKNTGLETAKDLRISIDNLKTDEITQHNTINGKSLGNVAPNAVLSESFNLFANEALKTGSYPLTFKINYKDEMGNEQSDSFTYYFSVKAKDEDEEDKSRAIIEITNASRPTTLFTVNQEAAITVKIANTGEKEAKNIKITAAADSVIAPKSAGTIYLTSLAAGETKEYTFKFAPTQASKTQNYGIEITVEYETAGNSADKATTREFVGINVSNPDTEEEQGDTSQPKIIISDYVINPLIVQAGEEFDIDLVFQNTHLTKAVKNVTVTLSVVATETEKGSVFSPVGSSNMFFIDYIEPKGFSEQHIRMYTVTDAKARNYTVIAKFDYEDADGVKQTYQAEFGVTVKQVTRLEIGEVSIPDTLYAYSPQWISFSVHNTGQVMLRNLKIRFEGEGIDTSSAEQIFGNFTAGSYNYYDSQITPFAGGQTTLRLIVSYDDDMGERIEETQEFEVFVISNEPNYGDMPDKPIDLGMEPAPEPAAEKGFFGKLFDNKWFWIGGGVVLALAVITVTAVIIRKRKRSKGFDFDE